MLRWQWLKLTADHGTAVSTVTDPHLLSPSGAALPSIGSVEAGNPAPGPLTLRFTHTFNSKGPFFIAPYLPYGYHTLNSFLDAVVGATTHLSDVVAAHVPAALAAASDGSTDGAAVESVDGLSTLSVDSESDRKERLAAVLDGRRARTRRMSSVGGKTMVNAGAAVAWCRIVTSSREELWAHD